MRTVGDAPVQAFRLKSLEEKVSAYRLTEHVVRGLSELAGELEDVIEQDEFTLDWVVHLPDDLWLVFDTT